MRDRRRSPTLLAVLVLVSLVLLTLDYRQGDGGSVAAVQRGAMAVFSPVQQGFAAAVRPIGGLVSSISDLGRLRSQNAALNAELDRLREGRVSVADLERENRELRDQLAMRERLGFTTTGARVIAQPPGAFEWSVLIDSGTDNGLREGMAVVNAEGLVGKIVQVTRGNARVRLLTSPQAGFVVKVATSGEQGFLSGRGSQPFQLDMTDAEAELEEDAEIVTHSFVGSTIPDGIPVGEVAEHPQTDEAGGAVLSVRPYVDFSRLSLVQVVLDAPEHPTDLDPAEPPAPDAPPSLPEELESEPGEAREGTDAVRR